MTTKIHTSNLDPNMATLFQTLTDGATISWDLSIGNSATVLLGGNRAIANPTNLRVGTCLLIVTQDITGSRTLTWGTLFKWPSGQAPILSTAGNSVDIISLFCNGTVFYGSYLRGMI